MKNRVRAIIVAALTIALVAGNGVVSYADEVFTSTTTGNITTEVEYDCIIFGSYPQTEIVFSAEDCGTYGKIWGKDSDYETNEVLYEMLMKATWNSKGDTVIDGVKYHRIKKANASYSSTGRKNYYDWNDAVSDHYFRYEPIRWRILRSDGDSALILSENVLDCQVGNKSDINFSSWEKSYLRGWLNDSFYNRAFSTSEKTAIIKSNVNNNKPSRFGISGGNNTKDNIFLLHDSDICDVSLGFWEELDTDPARAACGTTYAKAMGVRNSHLDGTCSWWLRSLGGGDTITDFFAVEDSGFAFNSINVLNKIGVRPVLELDLSKNTEYYSTEGTGILTTRTYDTIHTAFDSYPRREGGTRPEVTINGLVEGRDFEVSYDNNDQVGIATITATGIGAFTGSISKTIEIREKIDISDIGVALKEKNYMFKGKPCFPAIEANGLKENEDYTLDCINNNAPGIAKATITGMNGYEGSITLLYRLFQNINTCALSSTPASYVYTGSTIKPSLSVQNKYLAGVSTLSLQSTDSKSTGYLTKNSDYSLTYKNNKSVGKATIVVSGQGSYTGTKTKTFKILPKKAPLKKVSIGKRKLIVYASAKPAKTGGTVYQIKYKQKGTSKWKTTTTTSYKKTIKSLKKGKKYYVKMRAYKKVSGVVYYGAWSKTVLSKKIK